MISSAADKSPLSVFCIDWQELSTDFSDVSLEIPAIGCYLTIEKAAVVAAT